MIARALIVVLAVLNLGVAAWWLLRPEPEAVPPPAPVPGVAVLEIVHTHAGFAPAPADGPVEAAAAAPATVCLRAGPFRTRAEAVALQRTLAPLAGRSALEEVPGEAGFYRVILPPAPDGAVAEEMMRRVQAAGFSDVLMLHQGVDANAVALGSYRNRETAERRIEALRQAGFPAQLRAAGEGSGSRWWLRLSTAQPADVRAHVVAATEVACERAGEAAGAD